MTLPRLRTIFVLLWGDGSEGAVIPLLVSLGSGWSRIHHDATDDAIYVDFSGSGPRRIAMSLPYGIDVEDPDLWQGAYIFSATDHLRRIDALARNQVVDIVDTPTEDPIGQADRSVTVEEDWVYENLDGGTAQPFVAAPPLISYIQGDPDIDWTGTTFQYPTYLETDYATKYGRLWVAEGLDSQHVESR